MSDRRTGADQAQTQGLRQDVARWLREAADETRKMDRVQWTPYHISRLTELVRNARDSAE